MAYTTITETPTTTLIASSTDLAWAAGIIDGEGCIGIYGRSRGYHEYFARLFIRNSDLKMIQKLQSIFQKGTILKQHTHNSKWKDTYSLSVSHNPLKSILKQVYPYLVTKRERAKYAMEYIGRKINKQYFGYRQIPSYEIAQREFFYDLFKHLNKRGGGI